MRKYLKSGIDIAMFGLMLFLLSYPVTRGLLRHGYCGMIMLALFVCHHLLNLRWYRTLPKGRWTMRRSLATGVDLLLFLTTGAVFVSCFLMAGDVFAFAPFPMIWWARSLHTCATAWLFMLAAIHLGLHWPGMWNFGRRVFGRLWLFVAIAISMLGIYYFVQTELWRILFLLDKARYIQESLEQFFIQYLALALGLYTCTNLLKRLFTNYDKNSRGYYPS